MNKRKIIKSQNIQKMKILLESFHKKNSNNITKIDKYQKIMNNYADINKKNMNDSFCKWMAYKKWIANKDGKKNKGQYFYTCEKDFFSSNKFFNLNFEPVLKKIKCN